jgi:hypothetical protein
MSNLEGIYRNSGIEVNYNDKDERKDAIRILKIIKNWDLHENPAEKKIDLLHDGKSSGVDVEQGHWIGKYRDQNSYNFNQFTLPYPTGNFQTRKEKYLKEHHEEVNDWGNLKTYYTPDYKDNSLIRFNEYRDEFFFVNYEIYLKKLKEVGYWRPHTVHRKEKEYWMCWELKDLEFWTLVNGVWVRDRTLEDPKVYKEYLDNYRIEREKYLKANKNEICKSIY